MYKNHPSLVFGFHACERVIGEEILAGSIKLKASENAFDWLGSGMYFWENSPHKAQSYGKELKERRNKLKDPMVIGAIIHLGRCFDLLESHSLSVLQAHYQGMKNAYHEANLLMPENESAYKNDNDKLYRKLDCAVFLYMHSKLESQKGSSFDTIRGAFWEGNELYPGAGFKEKSHIQICVRNPNCIKGYFRPLTLDPNFPNT